MDTILRIVTICAVFTTAPVLSSDKLENKDSETENSQTKKLSKMKITAQPHEAAPLSSIKLDTPGTTSIIGRTQMDQQMDLTIRDLVRYEPGVSAIGTAGRFGLDSFNIRGLSGNRTYMEMDGVPMADSFGGGIAGGGFRGGRDFINLDQLKEVEIIRGPASALYPSSALGGSVLFKTKDPADYLKDDQLISGLIKEQYDSADGSFSTTASLATGNQEHGFLLTGNHRIGHQLANMGTVGGVGATRTLPDPMHYDIKSLNAKYVHNADGRRDFAIFDIVDQHTNTTGLSQLVTNRAGFTPNFYNSQDSSTRVRGSAGQEYSKLDSIFANRLNWTAYWQQSQTRNDTQTDTDTGDSSGTIDRFFNTTPLRETVVGGKLVATKVFSDQDSPIYHQFNYGTQIWVTNAKSSATGYGVNTLTGATGSGMDFLPGTYPMHLIPESNTYRYQLFGEYKIELFDRSLVITPGLREEYYSYQPEDDVMYRRFNPMFAKKDYTVNHLSPKFGLLWHFNKKFSLYTNYANGFRPPLFSDISGGWSEQAGPGFNIGFLPNPDLKAETSQNMEIGIRGEGDLGWFNVATYYNSYDNFMWQGYALPPSAVPSWASQAITGAGTNLFFQTVNASKAWIQGVELSGLLQLGTFSDSLRNWSLRGNAVRTAGQLIEPGNDFYSPLNTVDPAKLVASLDYTTSKWGAQLVGTLVHKHEKLSDPSFFLPPGYGIMDFFVHYTPVENLTLFFGANNLTNAKYWDWGNLNSGVLGNFLSGNGANDAGTGGLPADRLTMPGRTFTGTVQFTF
ncbi:TonB-dependent hemoglobin/transferrin/lactoferrin family receptor [Candidatus Nitrosacidococcus tergens]|uniref:TonB-dependent heme/hemoglobin receptor family protein/TonB-dependent hemoglobin/transferrin/lactoferrin receptor family protein n=1 Tax=Candidatus Nitrosacidococcus tergens TaxID=553981 RepID=A0A7G1Q9A4_9GAMM|nr:TonB-dependent hemoglobin/transferrin/lactoferrin family receptor [Candidatus Nitrosacidococcus tergens]CAB1275834.1 TonB-dependent heme/hemoglobin receptor family protein/TonB-dependent hemoglobin/transferrin/lactoferrin receptor family protein [Candidatus Nitrosacidococcus tergens]